MGMGVDSVLGKERFYNKKRRILQSISDFFALD